MVTREHEHVTNAVSYHEKLAGGWSAAYAHGGFHRRLVFVDRLLRTVVEPGSIWLDAGCGSGVLTRRLVSLGASGEALDAAPSMIRQAKEAAGREPQDSPRFAYRLVDTIEQLDQASDTFDGVLCSSVIEYLDHPKAAMHELVRVLKPGGWLVVSLANRRSLVRRGQQLMRRLRPDKGDSYLNVSTATFSHAEARTILADCGVKIERFEAFDPVLPGWTRMFLPCSLVFVVGRKQSLEQK